MRIYANEYTVIPLGVQTDSRVTEVAFDLTPLIAETGDGTAVAFHMRPTDANAYPCATYREDNLLVWQVTDSDTAIAGNGQVKVVMENDDKVINTITKSTVIFKTFASDGEVPEPYQAWVNQIIQAASDAQDAKDSIEAMTATASINDTYGTPTVAVEKTTVDNHVNLDFDFENLRGNGITDAELNNDYTLTLTFNNGSYTTPSIRGEKGDKGDKGNVMYATFELDPLTGTLSMTYDTEYSGAEFALVNGYLEVTV